VAMTSEYRPRHMCKMSLFYTDTEHMVQPVQRGYRIVIQYEIIKGQDQDIIEDEIDKWHYDTNLSRLFKSEDIVAIERVKKDIVDEEEEEPPSPISLSFTDVFEQREMDEHVAWRLVSWLRDESATIRTPALMLSHLYPVAYIGVETLRGFDKLMHDTLVRHFDIEFMPVGLFMDEARKRVVRCVSLHKQPRKRHTRDLTLFVTPTFVHCIDSLEGALLGSSENPVPHFNYTTVAMILHKISKM